MKKLIILLLVFFLSGCATFKKVSDKKTTTKQTTTTETKKDSSNVTNVNRAIDDKIITPVQFSVNPEVNKLLEATLSKLNTVKKSGSNSYSQFYNPKLKQFETHFTIGETKDVEKNTNKSSNTATTFEQNIDSYIYKKVTTLPWWAYLAILYLFRSQLLGIISFFIPGITGIKTIVDLKKVLTPKIRSPVN